MQSTTQPMTIEQRIALHSANEAAQVIRSRLLRYIRSGHTPSQMERLELEQFASIERQALRTAGIQENASQIPTLSEVVRL